MKHPKWTEVEEDRKLTVLLREITDVCTVSETAQRVMELTRAGEVNLTAVVDAVMKDPLLAAELLRLANSPLFGQAKQIDDLKRAVVVIGMQELHNIAAAMSMMAAFASPNPLSEKLRNTSVLSAAFARLTAKVLGNLNESTAFLAGLLGEIGAMACTAVDTTQYSTLFQNAAGDRGVRAKLETERYTAASDEIAYHVLKQNRLPDDVAAAVKGDIEQSGLLGQITDLSRQAAPLIIRAAEEAEAKFLIEDIPALADLLGLPRLDPNRWMEICLKAAATAELSLRGELMLTDETDIQSLSHPPQDPAAFEMKEIVYAETEARKTQTQTVIMASPEKPVRLDGVKTSRTPPVLAVLVLAAAAGVGAALWFLLQ